MLAHLAIGHILPRKADGGRWPKAIREIPVHTIGPMVTNGVMTAGSFRTYVLAMTFLNENKTGWQFLSCLGVVACGLLLVTAKAQLQRGGKPPNLKG